jgi:hypothetical protein
MDSIAKEHAPGMHYNCNLESSVHAQVYAPWNAAISVRMEMIFSRGNFAGGDCPFTGKSPSIRNAD